MPSSGPGSVWCPAWRLTVVLFFGLLSGAAPAAFAAPHLAAPVCLPPTGAVAPRPETQPSGPLVSTRPSLACVPDDSEPSAPGAPPDSPSILLPVVAAALVGAGIGTACGFMVSRRGSRAGSVGAATVTTPPAAPARAPEPRRHFPPEDGLVGDLIEGLIASYDLSTTDGQRVRVLAALRRANVTCLQPSAGEEFDPSLHLALDSQEATSRGRPGQIARTERPGWKRGEELLRHPEVVVWR